MEDLSEELKSEEELKDPSTAIGTWARAEPSVIGYVCSTLFSYPPQDREDIVVEVMTKYWQYESLRGNKIECPEALGMTIAKRAVVDYLRSIKTSIRRNVPLTDDLQLRAAPDGDIDRDIDRRLAMMALRNHDRQAHRAVDMWDRGYRLWEIAEELLTAGRKPELADIGKARRLLLRGLVFIYRWME